MGRLSCCACSCCVLVLAPRSTLGPRPCCVLVLCARVGNRRFQGPARAHNTGTEHDERPSVLPCAGAVSTSYDMKRISSTVGRLSCSVFVFRVRVGVLVSGGASVAPCQVQAGQTLPPVHRADVPLVSAHVRHSGEGINDRLHSFNSSTGNAHGAQRDGSRSNSAVVRMQCERERSKHHTQCADARNRSTILRHETAA